jgi:hypothetical protein
MTPAFVGSYPARPAPLSLRSGAFGLVGKRRVAPAQIRDRWTSDTSPSVQWRPCGRSCPRSALSGVTVEDACFRRGDRTGQCYVGSAMYSWLMAAPSAVLRRAEDLAVAQAQRYFETDRAREALREYRIAQIFGAELNRRGER